MKLRKSIGIVVLLLMAQLSALGTEIAVLRNGFTIRIERKQQNGDTTRLYTSGGFLDVPTAEIASFEPDDTADVAPDQPSVQNFPAMQPVATNPPVASVGPVPATPVQANLDQVVREASSRHRLDPDFVNSVIKAESNFQSRAVSRKGAQGLMQLMPGTASKLGVTDPFDPQANVEGGAAYLSQLLDKYHDDPVKALAAYNAGPNRVEQYHGVPPYVETRAYVARIVRDFNAKKRAQMKAQTGPPKTAKNVKKKASKPAQEASVTRARKPA
jgi:Transglycosylase SLT domain